MQVKPPWRPMNEAPHDGTIIIVMYNDLSGLVACFWGVYNDNPNEEGWFEFTYKIGDFERTEEAVLIDDAYGWMPYPEP